MKLARFRSTASGDKLVSLEEYMGRMKEGQDAIYFITGDNVYPCGVKSANDPKWSVVRPLSALGVPLYPVLGNHDYCGNPDAQIGAPLPNWNLPAPKTPSPICATGPRWRSP